MIRSKFLFGLCLSVLFSAALSPSGQPQESPDFAGDWVIKIGNRVFVLITLTPVPGAAGHFTGSLARPQHFTITGGGALSNIKGPVVQYPIVRGNSSGNCLSFTAQNPADKNDEDNFLLCIIGQGRGTLKLDFPGFESSPVTKDKGPLVVATDWDNTRNYFLDDSDVSNPDMQRIFEEDQRVREPGMGKIDWAVVNKTDAARREATRKLLADGKLHTGEDFERAAFAFQHGDTPEDYLLAHTLSMVAVARGQSKAIWIAAATLDRYLNSIHQPQIFGTQFDTPSNGPVTQEPYNRSLISDALRRYLSVPSQATQDEQRKQYEKERSTP